jgi:hypothetical protein
MAPAASSAALPLGEQTSHPVGVAGQAEDDPFRTIFAAHTLAQHDLSGLRAVAGGGVSDLGGGGQPTAEASAASASRSPLPRTRNVAIGVARPGAELASRFVALR